LDLSSLQVRESSGTQISFAPGMYSLELSDASDKLNTEFIVVPKDTLPNFPTSLLDERLPSEMRETVQAAWLAAQGAGRWRWEAYLRLEGLSQDYAPARTLRKGLRQGIVPKVH